MTTAEVRSVTQSAAVMAGVHEQEPQSRIPRSARVVRHASTGGYAVSASQPMSTDVVRVITTSAERRGKRELLEVNPSYRGIGDREVCWPGRRDRRVTRPVPARDPRSPSRGRGRCWRSRSRKVAPSRRASRTRWCTTVDLDSGLRVRAERAADLRERTRRAAARRPGRGCPRCARRADSTEQRCRGPGSVIRGCVSGDQLCGARARSRR